MAEREPWELKVAVAFLQFHTIKCSGKWNLYGEYSCFQLADAMIQFDIDISTKDIEKLCLKKTKKDQNKKSGMHPDCIVSKVKSLGWEMNNKEKSSQYMYMYSEQSRGVKLVSTVMNDNGIVDKYISFLKESMKLTFKRCEGKYTENDLLLSEGILGTVYENINPDTVVNLGEIGTVFGEQVNVKALRLERAERPYSLFSEYCEGYCAVPEGCHEPSCCFMCKVLHRSLRNQRSKCNKLNEQALDGTLLVCTGDQIPGRQSFEKIDESTIKRLTDKAKTALLVRLINETENSYTQLAADMIKENQQKSSPDEKMEISSDAGAAEEKNISAITFDGNLTVDTSRSSTVNVRPSDDENQSSKCVSLEELSSWFVFDQESSNLWLETEKDSFQRHLQDINFYEAKPKDVDESPNTDPPVIEERMENMKKAASQAMAEQEQSNGDGRKNNFFPIDISKIQREAALLFGKEVKENRDTESNDQVENSEGLFELIDEMHGLSTSMNEWLQTSRDDIKISPADIRDVEIMSDLIARSAQKLKTGKASLHVHETTRELSCMLLLRLGVSKYNMLIEDVPFLSVTSAQKPLKESHSKCAVNRDVIKNMSKLNLELVRIDKGNNVANPQRHMDVVIAMDETGLTSGMSYHQTRQEISGMTDVTSMSTGYKVSKQSNDKLSLEQREATDVASVMVCGLTNGFITRFEAASYFVRNTTAADIQSIKHEVILALQIAGFKVRATITDCALEMQKAQGRECDIGTDYYKFAGHCMYRPHELEFWIFDPSHLVKTMRNNFSYSQSPESSKKATRKLYLVDPSTEELSEHPIYWDRHFMDPFIRYQEQSFRRIDPRLTVSVFYAVMNNFKKMNVKQAAAFFSSKMQRVEDDIIESLETLYPQETALQNEIKIAVRSSRPFKKLANQVFDICNGVKNDGSGNRERLNASSQAHFKILTSMVKYLEEASSKIGTSNHHVQHLNGFTDTMNKCSAITLYGLVGFVNYMASLNVANDVFLGNLTSDMCERHFANFKMNSGRGDAQGYTATATRGNAMRIFQFTRFVKWCIAEKKTTQRDGAYYNLCDRIREERADRHKANVIGERQVGQDNNNKKRKTKANTFHVPSLDQKLAVNKENIGDEFLI